MFKTLKEKPYLKKVLLKRFAKGAGYAALVAVASYVVQNVDALREIADSVVPEQFRSVTEILLVGVLMSIDKWVKESRK